MDPIDIDIMEEDMPIVAMIQECAHLWSQYGNDAAPETNVVWDDLKNVVRQDLSTLRKYRRSKRVSGFWTDTCGGI